MHRASGPGSADQIFAAKLLVDDIVAADALNIPDGVRQHLRGGLVQQPRIEFKPAYRMLHAGNRQVQTLEMPMQAPEAEETVRISTRVELDVRAPLRGAAPGQPRPRPVPRRPR